MKKLLSLFTVVREERNQHIIIESLDGKFAIEAFYGIDCSFTVRCFTDNIVDLEMSAPIPCLVPITEKVMQRFMIIYLLSEDYDRTKFKIRKFMYKYIKWYNSRVRYTKDSRPII